LKKNTGWNSKAGINLAKRQIIVLHNTNCGATFLSYTRISNEQIVMSVVPNPVITNDGVDPMKKLLPVKLLTITVLTAALTVGCASFGNGGSGGASKASPEATAAIANAGGAIKAAKANNWIWRDTEKFLKQAKEAAGKGENDAAIKLANKAKFQAEAAVIQYNREKNNPRGL